MNCTAVPFKVYHTQIGATYETDGSAICDRAVVLHKIGMAYIFDGADHNHSDQRVFQDKFFKQFDKSYAKQLEKQKFASLEEAVTWVQEQIRKLAQTWFEEKKPLRKDGSSTADYPGAFVFVQVLKSSGKYHLLYGTMDDCFIFKKGAVVCDSANKKVGLGGHPVGRSDTPYNVPIVRQLKVKPGEEVFLFSDGAGEFLTPEALGRVIQSNTSRPQLLQELKERIQGNHPEDKGNSCSFGYPTKQWNSHPEAKGEYDDLSLVWFKV